jgi:hypothetical protein
MTVAETMVAGRYRLHHSLGSGGMGRVWLARDEVLRRDVAIKEVALPPGLSDEERVDRRARTLREARAAARLSHPNVVQVYDVVCGEEQPWIVMEYVPSRSLHHVVNANGPLGVREVATIGLAVLSALEAAHRSNVLHRDVKPSNVLIAEDGRIVLTDFGLATMDEGDGAITQTGLILGSPAYISPERAQTGVSTRESDLWSLGATLYAAVEGRPPYSRPTALGTLIALGTERPDPMRRAGDLKPVLAGLLRRQPRARLTAGQARWLLGQVARGEAVARVPRPRRGRRPIAASAGPAPVSGAAPGTPSVRVGGQGRWHGRPWAAAGIAAATVATVAAVTLGTALTHGPTKPARKGDGAVNQPPGQAALAAPMASKASAGTVDPDALPAGWMWYSHETGFRVPVPANWTTVQADDTSTVFSAPGGLPILQVGLWKPSHPVLVTALQLDERETTLSNYRRVRIEPLPQDSAAEWEYSFQDPKMGLLHGLDRVFVVAGQPYLVRWRTSPDDWLRSLSQLQLLSTSFRAIRRPAVAPT